MDALACVVDYVGETSSMMEEDNSMLCKECKDSGINITLENMFYDPGLQGAIDVFSEMYDEHGEEFDAYQKALGKEYDVKAGFTKVTAEA